MYSLPPNEYPATLHFIFYTDSIMKSVPASQNIPHLIDQLRSLNGGVVKDECLRKELYETINELSLSIESPRESVLRIMYSVRSSLD